MRVAVEADNLLVQRRFLPFGCAQDLSSQVLRTAGQMLPLLSHNFFNLMRLAYKQHFVISPYYVLVVVNIQQPFKPTWTTNGGKLPNAAEMSPISAILSRERRIGCSIYRHQHVTVPETAPLNPPRRYNHVYVWLRQIPAIAAHS